MQRLISQDYLMHHGVKGMKWGVRNDPKPLKKRFQNNAINSIEKRRSKKMAETDRYKNTRYGKWVRDVSNRNYDRATAVAKKAGNGLSAKQKKILKGVALGATVVGAGIAVYGGYKLSVTRAGNKAAVAKFLENNPDIANSVLKGGKPYKNPVERIPKYLSGVASKGSTISKGKIHNSIKGPTLQTTRSTVTAYAPPNYAGINPPYVSKVLERDAIGAKGRGRIMTKEQQKYYNKLYKDYIRSYKKR